jgi:type VI secretion system protein VasG
MKLCEDPDTRPEPEALADALKPELLQAFPAALLGRMIIVPYYALDPSALKLIIGLQLGKIRKRMARNHGAELVYDDTLLEAVAGLCNDPQSGARNIDHILTRSLLPEISTEILNRMAKNESVTSVRVGLAENGTFNYDLS